jgi:hypothetical protein
MALKPGTIARLARAECNRQIARARCDPQQTLALQPPPLEWAAVAAFYAAVHYVNALFFERFGQPPRDHLSRRQFVARTVPLRRALDPYDQLADLGWHARYTATFQPTPRIIREAVHSDLDEIRTVVYQPLGAPLP